MQREDEAGKEEEMKQEERMRMIEEKVAQLSYKIASWEHTEREYEEGDKFFWRIIKTSGIFLSVCAFFYLLISHLLLALLTGIIVVGILVFAFIYVLIEGMEHC